MQRCVGSSTSAGRPKSACGRFGSSSIHQSSGSPSSSPNEAGPSYEHRLSAGRRPPVDELRWCDLTAGQRVHHFDYGAGTAESSGPDWIYITWDNPNEHLNHHTAAIVRYLTRETHAVPTNL
ncbi:hypothetical protein E1263_26525 [Kribbella antibiotica]|uniref:Uncharacterized protein n=1 Tax=Kribbella antibiotica TaxID=190195 RepID=A0A4R4Z9Y3_9ACTN|nr:hypothetical protein E1263_26525 [Kribbella antibiotica]